MGFQTAARSPAQKRRVIVTLMASVIGIGTLVFTLRSRQASMAAPPALVGISFLGYSTNAAGQPWLTYRLDNHSSDKILALAELPSSVPGSGIFVNLGTDRPQTIELPAPAGPGPHRIQVSCFAEDRGLLTHVYNFVQRIRRKPVHQVTKLLCTLSGPVAEPQ